MTNEEKFQRRDIAEWKRLCGWKKPMLIEALRNMQTICPPRVSQQSKKDLERIVLRALSLADDNPVKLAMQQALKDALKWENDNYKLPAYKLPRSRSRR